MGDMTSGGAPRIKNIVAYLQGLAGTVLDGKVRTNLRRSDGTEVGTVDNPLHVDIGGNVPDTVGLAKIGGADTAVGAGDTNSGTLRVAVASNDVNLSAIKTATESSATALDVSLSTVAKESTVSTLAKETGGNLDDIAASTSAASTTLSSQLDITLSALKDAILGTNTKDFSTLQTTVDAIKTAVDAIQAFRTTPVVTTGTGNGAIAVSYAPNKVFYLDVVTVHLSAAPTTAGDLTVTLDAADGAAYDTVLFRIDPSADAGATDIVFSPLVPIPCAGGDAIVVAYANANGVTHGTRIVARAV